MDATGLWFSKLESNFYADYGQFRWSEEQRTWDWSNLTTVDLVSTKDDTKRLVLRRKEMIHTKDGRPDIAEQDGNDASLRYMIGIDIDDGPGDIKCDYYTARVYDHCENRWNLIGPKRRESFQIGDNAWLWQWADEKCESSGAIKETRIRAIHEHIDKEFKSKNLVYTNKFSLDVDRNSESLPVIYQPAVDGMKNFIREIHCSTKEATNEKKEVEVTIVFNNEELRKHKILNKIYEHVRLMKYGRLRDIEGFVMMADLSDGNVNGLRFNGIYSGKNNLEEDTIHGDAKGNLPPHRVKYYANDYNHPIIFVNTSNHAMAENDTNPNLWKWEYIPWIEDRPFISGDKPRKAVEDDYRNPLRTFTSKLLKWFK
jgi:hypothetical protein